MDPLEQLRKDNNCLKEQIMFLLKYCLAATSWSPHHTSTNNNKYQKGTLVWYENYVYECLVSNNSIPVNNEYYWHKINLGHLLAQEVPIPTTPGPGIYSFVSPLVETNEVVSILQATIEQDGYLSAIDWETFNNKQDALPVGNSSQYLKGDLTLGTFPSIPTKTSDLTNDGSDGTNPFITANVLTSTITDGDITHAPNGKAVFDALADKQDLSEKNASSGYVGLSGFQIAFKNHLNTITSFFANYNTGGSRTYTFPDKSMTVAGTDDIPTELSELNDDSTHRLVTDTQISTWDGKQNTLTESNFGTFSSGLTSKTTPVDADTMNISDSADLNKAKKVSLTNLYDNYIKPKIDSVFATIASPTFTGTVTTPAIVVSSETASRVAIIDASKNVKSADTTTYPNLTELSYIKGLTSSAQSQITANAVNVITITTSISIDTDTTSGGYGQHGRHTKISNGANAINLTVQTSSNADFVASYEKIGSSTITFVAGSGATLTTLSGTASMTGIAGSKACLSRNGNTYYLQITNY